MGHWNKCGRNRECRHHDHHHGSQASATAAQATTLVSNDKLNLTATLTAAGARAITEVGVFDAVGSGSPATGGNMNIYGDFAAINLASGDSIAFTIGVTFS